MDLIGSIYHKSSSGRVGKRKICKSKRRRGISRLIGMAADRAWSSARRSGDYGGQRAEAIGGQIVGGIRRAPSRKPIDQPGRIGIVRGFAVVAWGAESSGRLDWHRLVPCQSRPRGEALTGDETPPIAVPEPGAGVPGGRRPSLTPRSERTLPVTARSIDAGSTPGISATTIISSGVS